MKRLALGEALIVVLVDKHLRESLEADESFESFFAFEYRRLLRAAAITAGNRADGEDLAQEAMVRLFERWHQLSAVRDRRGYLYRVMFNLNKRRLRSRVLWPKAERGLDEGTARTELFEVIRQMKREDREAITLVMWLEFEPSEAAAILRVNPSTMRVRVHRARERLTKLLAAEG